MEILTPSTPDEVAAIVAAANRERRALGRDFALSLERLNRILEYNAPDLTICVQAGATMETIDAALREHRQWLPLGAPRPERTTVAAAIERNLSGPFRLFYGTARDMVIGVQFVTAEGRLVKSGGKVVKNVAGYDLAKLLIGSHGTLAVLTQVNCKVFPRPVAGETLALGFAAARDALAVRTALQASPLMPLAMDLLDATAARVAAPQELPPGDWLLLVAYGGPPQVIPRYRSDIERLARAAGLRSSATLSGLDEERVWRAICDLPAHMEEHAPDTLRLRVASTIQALGDCLVAVAADAVVARAGNGVTYFYVQDAAGVEMSRRAVETLGGSLVVEYAPPRAAVDRWGPRPDSFPAMQKIKQALDPNGILYPNSFLGGL